MPSRGSARFANLDRLWQRDLWAFARYLGVDDLPALAHELRAIADLERLAASEPIFCPQAEAARWRCAEELLWVAALREHADRREAAIRDGSLRVVQTSSALAWKQGRRVSVSVGIGWRLRQFALLEHPVVRDAMGESLHSIVLELFREQERFGLEVRRLRDLPDHESLVRVQRWEDEPSAAILDALAKLEAFIESTHAAGVSQMASKNASVDRKGLWLSPEAQRNKAKSLRKRHPGDRPRAIELFGDWADGYSKQHIRGVFRSIGWHGKGGRPKKGKAR